LLCPTLLFFVSSLPSSNLLCSFRRMLRSVIVAILLGMSSADDAAASGPTKAEIDEMLSEHNRYRKDAGVGALTWDTKLASDAQGWAGAGNMAHSTADGAFTKYGENIHMSCPHDTATQACKWWHDEITKYTGGNSLVAPHYTQMVWKSTKKVGCGKGPASCTGDLWVCQYLPMGNKIPDFVENVKQPAGAVAGAPATAPVSGSGGGSWSSSRLRLFLPEGVVFGSGAGWVGGMLVGASMVSAAMVGWRMMSRRTDQPTQEMQTDEMAVAIE